MNVCPGSELPGAAPGPLALGNLTVSATRLPVTSVQADDSRGHSFLLVGKWPALLALALDGPAVNGSVRITPKHPHLSFSPAEPEVMEEWWWWW